MTDRERYIVALRTWAKPKTPFRHQGRVKGLEGGVDCAGLVICGAIEAGIPFGQHAIKTVKNYANMPNGHTFISECEKYLDPLDFDQNLPIESQLQLGDIMTFWIEDKSMPRHISVFAGADANGNQTMIHSFVHARGVVEQIIDYSYWMPRVHKLYTLRDV